MTTKKIIRYAICCKKGYHSKNQDNFWSPKKFLPNDNEGLKSGIYKTTKIKNSPAFAVFDGMGGEKNGEVAAGIAASGFDKFYRANIKKSVSDFVEQVCLVLNKQICTYKDDNQISRMGTTAAVLAFGDTKVYFSNIGDSRIYRYRENQLTQISVDHSETAPPDRKAPLSQHLGIPPSEFIIEPYFNSEEYIIGDKYVLCSDGITDMLESKELIALLKKDNSPLKNAENIIAAASEKQGKDDMTIIICEVE